MQALNCEDDAHINDGSDSDCDNDEDEEELIIRNIKGKFLKSFHYLNPPHFPLTQKKMSSKIKSSF